VDAPPPIPCVFDGEAFRPLPNFLRVARQHYGDGEIVSLLPHEARSKRSHDHFFAAVHEAWQNLPEDQAVRFKDEEQFRKHALILTGHSDAVATVCMFKTEAARLAAALMQRTDEYAIITVNGKVVTRFTAKSQSLKAMGKEAFQQSKDDVLGFLANLLGVEVRDLSQARAA
jgi:hypothetical protein